MDILCRNLAIVSSLIISATKKKQAKFRFHLFPVHAGHQSPPWLFLVSRTWSYLFPHVDDQHGVLKCPFLQVVLRMTWLSCLRYSIITLFCIQVTSLAFWIELELIFTFICIQVVIMVFCIDLDSASPQGFFCTKMCEKSKSTTFLYYENQISCSQESQKFCPEVNISP